MPTKLTPYQLKTAIRTFNAAAPTATLLPTVEEKQNFAVCAITAIEILRQQFEQLEEYQQGLITKTELTTNLLNLVETHYRG